MDKCIYCNKKIVTPYTYIITKNDSFFATNKNKVCCCSDECGKKASSFYNYFIKSKLYFFISIFLSVGLIFSGAIIYPIVLSDKLLAAFMAGGFILLGTVLLFFPFATPESFEKWGIQRTTKIVRVLGICIIMVGPILANYLLR